MSREGKFVKDLKGILTIRLLVRINAFLFVIAFTILLVDFSFSYSQQSTHPSLTVEIGEFFNLRNGESNRKLTPQNIQWMRQGAIDEDEPARWINHFYDPVHNVGWSGKHFGRLTQEEGYKKGADIAFNPMGYESGISGGLWQAVWKSNMAKSY